MSLSGLVLIHSNEYREYHARVVAAVQKELRKRWPPTTQDEEARIMKAVSFFDLECTYEDDFLEGCDPDEVASENIEAAQ